MTFTTTLLNFTVNHNLQRRTTRICQICQHSDNFSYDSCTWKTVQGSAVQFSAMQLVLVQCNSVQFSPLQFSAGQCMAVLYGVRKGNTFKVLIFSPSHSQQALQAFSQGQPETNNSNFILRKLLFHELSNNKKKECQYGCVLSTLRKFLSYSKLLLIS